MGAKRAALDIDVDELEGGDELVAGVGVGASVNGDLVVGVAVGTGVFVAVGNTTAADVGVGTGVGVGSAVQATTNNMANNVGITAIFIIQSPIRKRVIKYHYSKILSSLRHYYA